MSSCTYYLAHGVSVSVVCMVFELPKSTVHDLIHRILKDVKREVSSVIKFPSGQELHSVTAGFRDLAFGAPAFSHVAGAIDGCHIRMRCSENQHDDYANYKQYPSVQMQGLCDHLGRFIDIFAGYPGSVNDARILRNSPLFHQALYPPAGYYILGDGAYPCLEGPIGIMTPYKRPLRNRVQVCCALGH